MTRRLLAFLHDLAAAALAWAIAFWLRFNLEIPPEYASLIVDRLPWVIAIHAAVFWALGLYRGRWRFASLPDLKRILIAVGLSGLAVPALFGMARIGFAVPRSVYLLAPLLLVLMMSSSRIVYRAIKEEQLGSFTKLQANPVIVLEAGVAGANVIKELAPSREWRVVDLLDDDPRKRGGEILGVKVLGPIDCVRPIADGLGATQAIIAMPGARGRHEDRQDPHPPGPACQGLAARRRGGRSYFRRPDPPRARTAPQRGRPSRTAALDFLSGWRYRCPSGKRWFEIPIPNGSGTACRS